MFNKIIYTIAVEAEEKVDDKTKVVRSIGGIKETLEGGIIYSPLIIENTLNNLSKTIKDMLEKEQQAKKGSEKNAKQ